MTVKTVEKLKNSHISNPVEYGKSSMAGCYEWCVMGIQLCRCKASSSGNVCFPLCLLRHYPNSNIQYFLGNGTAFLNALVASSNSLEEMQLCTFQDRGTMTPFPKRVTWNRDQRGNACPQEVVRFLCRLPSCPMQLCPTVPAVYPVFPDASVHLWGDPSMRRFNLLLLWAQVLQKIYLPA